LDHLKPHRSVEQIAKKHRMDVSDIQRQLDMGEPIEHEHTKDHKLAMDIALQHLDEFPDYYTRLKKMEASAKKEHKKFKDVKEETKSGDQGLHDWFGKSKSSSGKKGWVQLGGKFSGEPCARQPGQTSTPKCGSSKIKRDLSAKEEEGAFKRKNRLDPNQPEKTGASKPTNVRTEEMDLQEVKDKPGKDSGKKDACYSKVKSRYDVWPSAYASGALVKCRKVGAANWGTKSEAVNPAQQAAIAISMKKKGIKPKSEVNEETGMVRYCPKCQKDETRSECKYGEKYWDMFSLPMSLGKKYTPNTPHPGNFPESYDHEYSMARSELATIMSAAKRLRKKMKGEGNIEAWVQSKITKAADYIDAAADYVDSGESKVNEDITIEDANGNTFLRIVDIIKSERLVKETISPTIAGGKSPWKNPSLPKENPENIPIRIIKGKEPKLPLAKGEGGSPYEPYKAPKEDPKNPYVPAPKGPKVQLAHYEFEGTYIEEQVADTDIASDKKSFDVAVQKIMKRKDQMTPRQRIVALKQAGKLQGVDEGKTFFQFMIEANKSEMKCNSPKSDPVGDSLTGKSHVVKACEGGKEKLIRFGQRGVKGSPKKRGESKEYASRRHRFQTRHAKNIAKGKMSAAYWANKVKW
jgi:hypothetical protein